MTQAINRVPVLIEVRGDFVREIPLSSTVTLGRAADNTVHLDDPVLSRHHASVGRKDDGTYEVVDLGSTHGTWVGRQRIDRHTLADGDEIIIGSTRFFFRLVAALRTTGRRLDERIPCKLDVTLRLPDGRSLEGEATDMGLGGMRVKVQEPVAMDTVVGLTITMPHAWRRVRLRSRVVFASETELGIRFLFGSHRARATLAKHYARLLATSSQPASAPAAVEEHIAEGTGAPVAAAGGDTPPKES